MPRTWRSQIADEVRACSMMKPKPPLTIGVDLSDGVETHVEGHWKNGVLHITDRYEIVDGSTNVKETD
ncbi:MAG: hypothetical protein WA790_00160 [Sulfitobacter sp.]